MGRTEMRRILGVCALAIVATSFGARVAPLPSPACAVSGWGALICTMKVPVGGQLLSAVEDSIEVTVTRSGATLARTCIDGTVVGTKGLPKVAKGDIVRVRAFSRVTFAVVTVAKAGANLRYAPAARSRVPR
jgi:hypothetical protein